MFERSQSLFLAGIHIGLKHFQSLAIFTLNNLLSDIVNGLESASKKRPGVYSKME